jgi:hypothetical protein
MSLLARRLQQRALDELRKQTNMLVDTSVTPQGPNQPRSDTATPHDPACQMAATGRLDDTCGRCRTILAIAGS